MSSIAIVLRASFPGASFLSGTRIFTGGKVSLFKPNSVSTYDVLFIIFYFSLSP